MTKQTKLAPIFRSSGIRLIWILIVLLAVLGFIEASLRVFAGLGHPVLFVLDHAAGYLPAANQNVYRFGSRIVINNVNMRSCTFTDKPAVDDNRLLIIGDSVAFGPTFVDQEKIFSTRIEKKISVNAPSYCKVLNASAPGWAVGNELGYVKSRGISHAKNVVLILNTGDLDQPFATLNGDEPGFPTKNPPFAIWEALSRYALPRLGLGRSAVDPGSTATSKETLPTTVVLSEIDEMRRIVQAQGGHFLVLYSPGAGKQWETAEKYAARDQLFSWAKRSKVDVIDMTPIYKIVPESQVYWDGLHLRPEGHRLVATAIEEALR